MWRIKLRKAANFTTVKPERKPHCVKFLEFKGPTRAHFCGSYSTIPNEVFLTFENALEEYLRTQKTDKSKLIDSKNQWKMAKMSR